MNKGILSLIGAGPGDPELITIKALRVLESADLVLYDSLVSPKIFNLTKLKDTVEMIFVGKRKGSKLNKQEDINALILLGLEKGQHVVRLKGGDPLIFARGIEEVELASNHGFPFQIVPGLTSGLAAAATNSLLLTLREKSDSVTLSTGHALNEEKLKFWLQVLESGASLIVYMGLSNVVEICAALKTTLIKDFPAAIISNATLDDEKTIISDISNLPQAIIDNQIKSPSLLVFGEYLKQYSSIESTIIQASYDAI